MSNQNQEDTPKTFADFIIAAQKIHENENLEEKVNEILSLGKSFQDNNILQKELIEFDKKVYGTESDPIRQWIVENLGKNIEDEVSSPAQIDGKVDQRLYELISLVSKSFKIGDKYFFGNLEDMDMENALFQFSHYFRLYDQITGNRNTWEQIRELTKKGRVGEAYEIIIKGLKTFQTYQLNNKFIKTLLPPEIEDDIKYKLAEKIGKKLKEAGHEVNHNEFIPYEELRNAFGLYISGKYDELKQRYPVYKKKT